MGRPDPTFVMLTCAALALFVDAHKNVSMVPAMQHDLWSPYTSFPRLCLQNTNFTPVLRTDKSLPINGTSATE